MASRGDLLDKITHIKLFFLRLMMTLALTRCPWGEESLLREDTDESLWFFGPAGENNYRVAGVSLLLNPLSHFLLGR